MDKGHWFWHSGFMNAVEKMLLDLTHWVWAKRHNTTEVESVPVAEVEKAELSISEPALTDKPAAKKPAAKRKPKAPKGNEWSVK